MCDNDAEMHGGLSVGGLFMYVVFLSNFSTHSVALGVATQFEAGRGRTPPQRNES